MKINNNIQALNSYRNLYQNQMQTSKNLEKLSSGLRINRAADDAAGLAISEKMRSQIRGLKQAERNALDGISLMQTSEGAMQEVHTMLQRMRELAVQASNDTNTEYDREQIQKEIDQLKLEIDSISEKTEFNTRRLLDGSSAVLSVVDRNSVETNLVGSPRVTDARIDSGNYSLAVHDVTMSYDVKQPFAGLGQTGANDIQFVDPGKPGQALGEYTIEIREFTGENARVTVKGPDGLPIVENQVINAGEGAGWAEVGGLNINAGNITGSGTVKIQIEATLNASVEKEGITTFVNREFTTRNGVFNHSGIEFKVNSDVQSSYIVNTEEDTNNHTISATSTHNVPTYAELLADLGVNPDTANVVRNAGIDEDGNPIFVNVNLADKVVGEPIRINGTWNNIDVVDNVPLNEFSKVSRTEFSVTNNSLAFQIGPNTNQNVMIDIPKMDTVELGIEDLNVLTNENANNAIFVLDQAINKISEARSKLGATQNRMEHTINNLQVTHENLTAAESRIRDADMALEMTEFTRNNILNQSATAMLAQANQLPQGVLQLLQ
ncbi:flagellin [Evansella cellulosilytica]|uniref:Flagellin n=1 Tax=Evansella cellulosilytica (strain ATCC 21833 / DSM 2522 / FERM P-1141 / JCM 9156 / N-4) TaxID=649639 RepID=E6TXU0_EVAC2|nr:flagellin [Evansella cellulosilytica]ADU30016.1 flagellin domain protein [Evansella cellulosilytica DSM 2522]